MYEESNLQLQLTNQHNSHLKQQINNLQVAQNQEIKQIHDQIMTNITNKKTETKTNSREQTLSSHTLQ